MNSIITNTAEVFNTPIIKEKLSNILPINKAEYKQLHTNNLVPLDIKINCEKFKQEILSYDQYFNQWGEFHTHLPKYGAPLVNLDGLFSKNDPTIGSLTAWNTQYPDTPYIETDFRVPTEILSMSSLTPLSVFNNYWTRSNILKWGNGAKFVPHIDTVIPAYWFRLWGTTDSNIQLGFVNDDQVIDYVKNIEAGRIYLIDTSKIHVAESDLDENVYQFFLSVSTSAKDILWKLIKTHLAAAK